MKLFAKTLSLILGFSLVFSFAASKQGSSQSHPSSTRSDQAIEKWTPLLTHELATKGLELGAPVFLRLTKTTNASDDKGYLEAFVKSENGRFELFKKWEICTYSGELGPKLKEGDGQSPEGFYFVEPSQMNPYSSYHLSFNLGFPNAFDRAHGRTGSFLMVHGDCVSIGCYAITDEGVEEAYTLMMAAFEGGQPFIRVHIFPFPMTDTNLSAAADNRNLPFWENLKEGWEALERGHTPPNVTVRDKRYRFDAQN